MTRAKDDPRAIAADMARQREALARVVHEAVQASHDDGRHRPFDDLSDETRALYERIGGAVAARVIREQVEPLLARQFDLRVALSVCGVAERVEAALERGRGRR